MAIKTMNKAFENSKDLTIAENNVTILSALNDKSRAQIKALAAELAAQKADAEAEIAAGGEAADAAENAGGKK